MSAQARYVLVVALLAAPSAPARRWAHPPPLPPAPVPVVPGVPEPPAPAILGRPLPAQPLPPATFSQPAPPPGLLVVPPAPPVPPADPGRDGWANVGVPSHDPGWFLPGELQLLG